MNIKLSFLFFLYFFYSNCAEIKEYEELSIRINEENIIKFGSEIISAIQKLLDNTEELKMHVDAKLIRFNEKRLKSNIEDIKRILRRYIDSIRTDMDLDFSHQKHECPFIENCYNKLMLDKKNKHQNNFILLISTMVANKIIEERSKIENYNCCIIL